MITALLANACFIVVITVICGHDEQQYYVRFHSDSGPVIAMYERNGSRQRMDTTAIAGELTERQAPASVLSAVL